MYSFKKYIAQWLIIFGFILFVTSCNTKTKTGANAHNAVRTSMNCDYTIWSHVYNPSRLKIIDTCKVVSGIITETNADDDGDQHMLLKLDPGMQNLLTAENMARKQGCLVIEAICVNNITKSKVGNACEGYINNIDLPKINDHVQVTGSYVIDSHNGWAEIHPISKIDLIKNK